MPEKRPFEGVENGDAKRSRSNNGSPAPASKMTDEERKRAEVAERIAAMKAKMAAKTQAPAAPAAPPTSSNSNIKEDAMARIAAMKARLSGKAAGSASPSPAPRSPAPQSPSPVNGTNDKQAERARALAAINAKIAQKNRQAAPPPPPTREDTTAKARGGLGIGLHPALLGDLKSQEAQKQEDKKRTQVKVNPYLEQSYVQDDERDPSTYDPHLGRARIDRKTREMVFNEKGKFIAQAEALRAQERLEKMKQEMQAQARKKAIEEATERSYLVQAPPEVEWWDEGLVNGTSYADIDKPDGLKFDVITQYVQHPVLLEPPQEKLAPTAKPMYLTKKEQAKMRRQRRMEAHKDEQMKIRLGILPVPEPKVKKSNLMRVLGSEAVKDPTAVEAMVNRQIEGRAEKHELMNEERKLTKEQRHEKLEKQKEMDAEKGIKVAVFRVENLSYGKHRYQIDVNAKQESLTGMTVLHPKMNLVIVEGGAHSVNFYKKLMLRRIKWEENAAPVGGQAPRDSEDKAWLQPLDEQGRVKDLSDNRCTLVWEGDEKQRAFKKWGSRVCETDGEAKDALARMKMENMWTLAQSMKVE
ncbi:U4/U5/U6 small nuclear ribonucleoprotein prp3 [Elsinoe australis]|uniref:U4/U5/U6 small nuclear ribonucleoprotein prp3 n=1 Tax=Elsinoe australis TaxID=40998 RepID=A0A4U7B7B0_9PEZI|nr:U4/U5/U6 small nuclear ribonucleoprotein prp3 [Elsinoe australis]